MKKSLFLLLAMFMFILSNCNPVMGPVTKGPDNGPVGGPREIDPSIAIPTNLVATDNTQYDHVAVTWNASTTIGVVSYDLWRGYINSAANVAPTIQYLRNVPAPVGTTVTYNDTNATPGQVYFYYVQAVKNGKGSDVSNSDFGSRKVLPSPTNLVAADGVSYDYCRLTWTASDGALSYEVWGIYWIPGPYAPPIVTEEDFKTYTYLGSTTSTTWDDAKLPARKVGFYYVVAVRGSQKSVRSNYDGGNIIAITAPTNVQADDNTSYDNVYINWTSVSDALSYDVYRSGTKIGNTTGISFTDTNVIPGIDYTYTVRSVRTPYNISLDSVGNIGARKIIPAPVNVTATDGTYTDRIVISWSAVAPATKYQIWRSRTESGTYTMIAEVPGTSYTDIAPGVAYWWYKVRAVRVFAGSTNNVSNFSAANRGYYYLPTVNLFVNINGNNYYVLPNTENANQLCIAAGYSGGIIKSVSFSGYNPLANYDPNLKMWLLQSGSGAPNISAVEPF